MNQDLTDARGRIADLQSQYSSTTAKLTETSTRVEAMERAERDKQQAEARRRDFAALRAGLVALATVKPSGNGFIATLPDAFFVPNQTALQLRVKSKMDALASLIAANRDAVFTIEGHAERARTPMNLCAGPRAISGRLSPGRSECRGATSRWNRAAQRFRSPLERRLLHERRIAAWSLCLSARSKPIDGNHVGDRPYFPRRFCLRRYCPESVCQVNRPRILRVRRILTDQIRANLSDPSNPWSIQPIPDFQNTCLVHYPTARKIGSGSTTM